MNYPPSLPDHVLARAFRAANGEVAISLLDANAFLDACAKDGRAVLGWELWLVNHEWSPSQALPHRSEGRWTGLIPASDSLRATTFAGNADLNGTRRDLAALDLDVIDQRWRDFVRVNFTLADE
jgi:hypothetical protein